MRNATVKAKVKMNFPEMSTSGCWWVPSSVLIYKRFSLSGHRFWKLEYWFIFCHQSLSRSWKKTEDPFLIFLLTNTGIRGHGQEYHTVQSSLSQQRTYWETKNSSDEGVCAAPGSGTLTQTMWVVSGWGFFRVLEWSVSFWASVTLEQSRTCFIN